MTPVSARTRRDLLLTACASALVAAFWIVSVPPFEGVDELHFYNRTVHFLAEPSAREPIFYRIAATILRLVPRPAGPVEPRYNPAFSYTGSQRGTVNRFAHERPVAARGHVRAVYFLRVAGAMMAVLTALCIYGLVRLALDAPNAALAVALICCTVPQVSFMNAVVHGESITRLFGAAVALTVVAGMRHDIGRPVMWVVLALFVAATPFVDRQGFFAVGLAALGVIMTERTWRRRALAVVALAVPVVALVPFISRYNESGNLGPWFQLMRHPLRPLLYGDPVFGSTDPPDASYYLFEFLPKLFVGFWGWLGQPSILMPPAVYGVLVAATLVGAAGALWVTISGRSAVVAGHPDRLRVLRVLACSIAIMCVPIAYGPALAGRNLWYGRWLFPMIGPIVMLLGVGWAAVLETPARRRRTALATAIAGLVAGALWMTPPGAVFRAAAYTNHYGDPGHLVAIVRNSIIAMLAAGGGVGLTLWVPAAAALARSVWTPAAAVIALNAGVLLGMVVPLYAPMAPDDYVALIRREIAEGRRSRAADVYLSAAQVYPESVSLRTLADELPTLLISRKLDEMSGFLQQQLARGGRLHGRDTWLALAQYVRANHELRSEALRHAIDDARAHPDPDVAEPLELVRLVLDGALSDPAAAARVIRAGRGRLFHVAMRNGEATLEGATAHTLPDGRHQVIVYYRPKSDWTSRRLWLHAYPASQPDQYIDPPPVMTGSTTPKPGDLDWAVFELPPGHYQGYVGIWVGTDLGEAFSIGTLP